VNISSSSIIIHGFLVIQTHESHHTRRSHTTGDTRLTVSCEIRTSYFVIFQHIPLLQLKCTLSSVSPKLWFRCRSMGVDHGGTGGQVPPEFGAGGLFPQILSCCKILSTILLALQCRNMYSLPLQQDFYCKSRHASPRIPVRSTPMCRRIVVLGLLASHLSCR